MKKSKTILILLRLLLTSACVYHQSGSNNFEIFVSLASHWWTFQFWLRL